MRMTKKVKIFSAVALVFVLVNGYLLLKDNDIIMKNYYINNVQFAVADYHEKVLETDAVVAAKQEHFIAAPVQSISEVLVTQGQSVSLLTELAIYKPEEAEREISRLETDRDAYENELSELERIVSDLQSENSSSSPSTATDSTTLGDNELWNINLTLELGIEQSTPTAEGIAIIQRSIAETERQISILDSMISQLSNNNSLTTPVDGIIKEIVLEGDSIIFQIQSLEKKFVAYVEHENWKEVEIGQKASVILNEGKEDELVIDGDVLEKQQIPARDSIAFNEMKKNDKVKPDDTVYEVSIEPTDMLTETPIGILADATITTFEANDSFQVNEDWLVKYEQDNSGNLIYTVGEDGKTRLEPVDLLFKHKAEIKQEEFMYGEPIEEIIKEASLEEDAIVTEPRIQTVELEDSKKEDAAKDEDLEDTAVFTAPIAPQQIFIDGDEKNLFAPTFRPYPLHTFEWTYVDATWKDALWYLIK
ncbi:HlyD family secretion protein [Solibacillus isronensis]|uniref:HlyD family secretion protein n=1 Tax=Solibacillus isronensis TaxID=412383 RepID=UPI00203D1730|nr:HlyD family secretion protein [Solibacillus isronensis]MCM3722519.1 HlyD family secretion protein [Solibacillus isronensis]